MKTVLLIYKNGKKELTKLEEVKKGEKIPRFIDKSFFDDNYIETKSFKFTLKKHDKNSDLYIYEEL